MSVHSALDGNIQRSTSKTFPSKKEENSGSRENCRSTNVVCAAQSDLGLPVNISIGSRILKKSLVARRGAIYGPMCVCSEHLMTLSRISVHVLSNFSSNRPEPISGFSFASSKAG